MSLTADNSSRRTRSRSPGGPERDQSRSRGSPLVVDANPYPSEGPRTSGILPSYDYTESPSRYTPVRSPRSPLDDSSYRRSKEKFVEEDVRYKYSEATPRAPPLREMDRHEGERYSDRDSDREREREEDKLAFLPQKYAQKVTEKVTKKVTETSDRYTRDSDNNSDRDRDRRRDDRDRRDYYAKATEKVAETSGRYTRDSDNGDRDRDRRRDDRDRRDYSANATEKVTEKVMETTDKYTRDSDNSDRDRDRRRDDRDQRDYADRDRDHDRDRERSRKDRYEDDLAYGKPPPPSPTPRYSRPESPPSSYSYAKPKQWEYAEADEKVTYSRTDPRHSSSLSIDTRYAGRAPSPGPQQAGASSSDRRSHRNSYAGDPRGSSASVVTVEPGQNGRRSKRDSSPLPPTGRMSTLSVSTAHHAANLSLSAAPGSPLLESYQGTYQSMSPMPSPLLLPSYAPGSESQVMDVSPIGSDEERSPTTGKKRARRARFTDPVDDAARLARALKGEKRAPETEPLIEILPGMTHEQIMELRVEYKRLVKTGPERKGVNVAKHIRARLKDEDPSLMKACYSVALGRWESEAYWANFWYQGDKTRRELLIESLIGRSNDEIRRIKEAFSDKKYDDSLVKCMRTELKEDKFKRAVLAVLDEQRMEDLDRHGRPLPLDPQLVEDDVRALYKTVRAEKGGESAMIAIVVQRSDSHLREVLQTYSAAYKANFARDALKKSGNLVGELLAHILNGVINKPVRDALLIHHALTASKRDELRRELLISRLVRFHWDRHHMAAVKLAFRERYGKDLQQAVKEGTSGEWGLFCSELCITRTPDDVRRVERVEVIR